MTSGFPRRSETFLLNELLALDAAGALGVVIATGAGDGAPPHPGTERLAARVRVLGAGSVVEQSAAAAAFLRERPVSAVHGYFAHRPAAVAAGAARLVGIPYGFGVHARDARKVSPAELGARARGAACVLACNGDAATEVGRAGARATLVPHGVDLRRFRPQEAPHGRGPLRLLAVGRLVEKKGFDVLIEALRGLALPFRLRIVGEGPAAPPGGGGAPRAGLGRLVEMPGAVSHADLPAEYAAADVVVTPSRAAGDGDRDGLPNVVLEAMACGRPVVAGNVGALSSGVVDGETGVLVGPGEPVALREALCRLARDPGLRADLGRAARTRAERRFDLRRCSARMHAVLEAAYA